MLPGTCMIKETKLKAPISSRWSKNKNASFWMDKRASLFHKIANHSLKSFLTLAPGLEKSP
jgi:hypothetical protein